MILKSSFPLLIFFLYFSVVKAQGQFNRTIWINSRGDGDFKYIQQAIDSIPSGNNQWIKIHLSMGIYMEKVVIPQNKGYLMLEGEGAESTVITWRDNALAIAPQNDSIANHDSSTFAVWAPNIVLKDLSFKNDYGNGQFKGRAIAVTLAADKIAVYNCSFIGIQDTLSDLYHRHYFHNCYIEGAVDFIWGFGQSIYDNDVTSNYRIAESKLYRSGQTQWDGSLLMDVQTKAIQRFVFKNCNVSGAGNTYLGRAWFAAARVIFYQTHMDPIVVPRGWDSNHYDPAMINFSEKYNTGTGANTNQRVKWMKHLSNQELNSFVDISYVDDGWISQQPIYR